MTLSTVETKMPERSERLIIFEGPDGAGKSTAARQLAQDIGARYVHLGPFPRVKESLAWFYIEAMMPALLGYQAVVMDRCRYSEVPYGIANRGGKDRIGVRSRILDRIALRCQTSLVWCVPTWERVRENFIARRGEEYLNSTDKLRTVYDWYSGFASELPTIYVDPFEPIEGSFSAWLNEELELTASIAHPTNKATSGNIDGRVVLVGEGFGDTADHDPLYQSPFGSVSASGCSMWLARQLEAAGIEEHDLFWINANELDETVVRHNQKIIALGIVASEKTYSLGYRDFLFVQHPQAWRRFRSKEHYELIPVLKGILNG